MEKKRVKRAQSFINEFKRMQPNVGDVVESRPRMTHLARHSVSSSRLFATLSLSLSFPPTSFSLYFTKKRIANDLERKQKGWDGRKNLDEGTGRTGLLKFCRFLPYRLSHRVKKGKLTPKLEAKRRDVTKEDEFNCRCVCVLIRSPRPFFFQCFRLISELVGDLICQPE